MSRSSPTSSQLIARTADAPIQFTEPYSQPIADNFRHRVLTNREISSQAQRPKGLPFVYDASRGDLNLAETGLRGQVFQEIKSRLQDAGMDIADLDAHLFAWMLPATGADPNDWNDLLNNPMFVSPDRLRRMVKMIPSPMRTSEYATVFYCRTFTFTLTDFLDLLQLLFELYENEPPDRLILWNHQISMLNPERDDSFPVYVRYIGQTTIGARSRYQNSLRLVDVCGIHYDFLDICLTHFPDVLTSADIEEFDRGTIEMVLKHPGRRLADTREQALIAMFGPTLLNIAKGGIGVTVQIDPVDELEISALKTKTLENMKRHVTGSPDLNELKEYGQSVQDYTSRHPETTGAVRRPITDRVRDMIVAQCLPATINGYTPLVTIGSDLGTVSYETCEPFFSGHARSSAFTVDCLNEIIRIELGFSTTTEHRVNVLREANFLPFVDLYPWTKKDKSDLPYALQMLRGYLQISNPLVILTFSNLVTAVAMRNFQRTVTEGQDISAVSGKPRIASFDHDIISRDYERKAIIIPCIHPGSLLHTDDNKLQMRLFIRSLAVAWLAMYFAAKISAKGGLSKKQIIVKILESMKPLIGEGSQFYRTTEQLRQDYKAACKDLVRIQKVKTTSRQARIAARTEEFASKNKQENFLSLIPADSGLSTSTGDPQSVVNWGKGEVENLATRCRKALEELYLVIDCDIAYGRATSLERTEQITRLRNVHATTLNIKSKRLDAFTEDLRKVQAGQLYYFSMTDAGAQALDLQNLLAFFPESSKRSLMEWINDNEAVEAASTRLQNFIQKKVLSQTGRRHESLKKIPYAFQELVASIDEDLAKLVMRNRKSDPTKLTLFQSSPHPVTIRSLHFVSHGSRGHGAVHFMWSHNGRELMMDDLMVPGEAIPIVVGEERFISFTKEGVDITDAQGRSFGTTQHRPVTILLDHLVTQLANHPLRKEFFALWEKETGQTLEEELFGKTRTSIIADEESLGQTAVHAYPASFFDGSSHGLPINMPGRSENTKVDNIRKLQCPFSPGDVGFLIYKFLEQSYPNGGEIDLCSPDIWPDSTSMWTKLRAFVGDSLWTHHPHRQTIVAACNGIKSVGLAGQGAGIKGEGHKIIRAMVRLIRVLRNPVTERPKEVKQGKIRRTKSILTVGGSASLPAQTIKNVQQPELEVIECITELQDIVPTDVDVDDDDQIDPDWDMLLE